MNTLRSTKLFLAFAFGFAAAASAQVRTADFRVHDRGELWETVKDDGTIGSASILSPFEYFPSGDWPGGPDRLASKEDQRSYHAGSGMWIGGKRTNGSVFLSEHGPFQTAQATTIDDLTEVENFSESPGFDPTRAEETITAGFTAPTGMRVRRISRSWSFRALNTFILYEYEVTNASGAAVTDLFVGFPTLLRPSYQDINVHNGWGDDFNRTDELVAFDAARSMIYSWDDTPNFDLPSDVGNYWGEEDELRTTGYAGIAMLDAPAGSGGEAQPSTVLWAQLLNNENRLTTANTTVDAIYAILSGEDTAIQADADDRLTPFALLAAGPYNLAPNASVRIVMAQAVNGIPLSEAQRGLAAQANLSRGADSLRASMDRARALFQRNFQVGSVPPPSPPLQIIPLPTTRTIAISWPAIDETWTDPISGGTIASYNIYRSSNGYVGPFVAGFPRRVRVGNASDAGRYYDSASRRWSIEDANVGLGFSYVYAVTAVDTDGNESWLTNRNQEPITVAGSAAEDALSVRVFPNPFRQTSGFPSTAAASSIIWNDLPAKATVRIYTSSGDLVRVLEHDDLNSGQEVWDQLNMSRQRVSPGIYFWTVTSDVGSARGTLVIIK